MDLREPHVAGAFYPGTDVACRELLERCVPGGLSGGEGRPVSGVVPHAGWIYSGPTAGRVFRAVADAGGADTFLLFGAVHVWGVDKPSLWARGAWRTPLGLAEIDEEAAAVLLDSLGERVADAPGAHGQEHSLEVQVPFIQYLFPMARIVPLMVPPSPAAAELGRRAARALRQSLPERRIVALGSTDLTHYGPSYGFTPAGSGEAALRWSREENDRRILDLALEMKADEIVEEAIESHNACGPGAMAAACGYASELGASEGELLGHTTSQDVMPERRASSFVGYAGIVYRA